MNQQLDTPAVPLPAGFPLFVHLPPTLHHQLQAQAEREGRTLAEVTRRALERYLRRPRVDQDQNGQLSPAPPRAGT